LAQQGFDVVLIARTTKDLETVADELQTSYGVKTLVVSMDAALCSESQVSDLVKELETKSDAVLVNSVGILNDRPVLVEEMQWSFAERIIQVNCGFTVLLTSRIIPLLKRHATQHGCRAAILIVGSLTSTTPLAMQSTYSATKAFDSQWSRCIAAELRPYSVDVLCVRPGLTASRMSGIDTPGGIVADADDFARRALGMLGLPVKIIFPFPPHAFLDWMGSSGLVPESVQDSATLSMNMAIQKEMDKKQKKTKKRK
jgi:short-subunit dehydrogenase